MKIPRKIFRARRPLREPDQVEIRQYKLPQVLGGYDVGKKQSDHFAPHDMLPTQPELPVIGRKIRIRLADRRFEPLVAADSAGVVVCQVINRVVLDTPAQLPRPAGGAPLCSEVEGIVES